MFRSRPSTKVTERIGRGDDRGTEPLEGTRADQRRLGPGETRQEGGDGEDHDADEEDPPSPEQVRSPAAEQQEAAEDERVGADHPLEILLREPEVDLDRGQRDVHDRDVQHDHELDGRDEGQRQPLASFGSHHGSSSFHSLRHCFHASSSNLLFASTSCATASRRATLRS
jgi:hypothetical protein